jgi:hypothetical protein
MATTSAPDEPTEPSPTAAPPDGPVASPVASRLASLPESYTALFDSVRWGQWRKNDRFWPAIVVHPTLVPSENPCFRDWMSKPLAAATRTCIVLWFPIDVKNLLFSCVPLEQLRPWAPHREAFEQTYGGKPKIGKRDLAKFALAIDGADAEVAKPPRERLHQFTVAARKGRRRKLPPHEQLVGRRLAIKDDDGETFLGEITAARVGPPKDDPAAPHVVLVNVLYDDAETDSDMDLAAEDFKWEPKKKARAKKAPAVAESSAASDSDGSSSSESDSDGSSSSESDSDSDTGHSDAHRSHNSEAPGVKRARALAAVTAYYQRELGSLRFPHYAVETGGSTRGAIKKKKKKKTKRVKKKYKGLSTEERREARRKANEEKLLRRAARKKVLADKQAEEADKQAEKVAVDADAGLKHVHALEMSDDDEPSSEEDAPRRRSKQVLDDEAEWSAGSPAAPKRKRRPSVGHEKKEQKKKKKHKKDKKEKTSSSDNKLAEYNKILLRVMATEPFEKKMIKKVLKAVMQMKDVTLSMLRASGIAKTIVTLTSHADDDVKGWAKGLKKLWKAQFKDQK